MVMRDWSLSAVGESRYWNEMLCVEHRTSTVG